MKLTLKTFLCYGAFIIGLGVIFYVMFTSNFNFNFELILFLATVITGVIALFDWLFLAKKRKKLAGTKEVKLPLLIDYAYAFFPVLLIVFLIRSFLRHTHK